MKDGFGRRKRYLTVLNHHKISYVLSQSYGRSEYPLTRYYMSGGLYIFILYNFMKQAVLGLHTHFKLTVSPFYFPHDRVTNLGVMFVVRDKVIHTSYITTLLSSGEKQFSCTDT